MVVVLILVTYKNHLRGCFKMPNAQAVPQSN